MMGFDREDILFRLQRTEAALLPHFGATEAELERSYAPSKWSVRALLAHLADCEFINLWRFSRAAAEDGSTVAAFEENDWAKNLDYASRPALESRDLFLGARRMLAYHVKTLPSERLLTSCRHPEKGLFPAWRWARLASSHLEHHLGQISAAREGRPWVKAVGPDSWEFGAASKPRECP